MPDREQGRRPAGPDLLSAAGGGDTIVAPATPLLPSAVAVVRLSGPGAFPVAEGLTGRPRSAFPPRTMTRAPLLDEGGGPLDDLLCCLYPAPSSYTGEDVAELFLHGNPLLVSAAVERACALGARPAAPGEFTRRAFLNGKMDLAAAEGVADLVAARTRQAAEAALRQSRGLLGDEVAPLRGELLSLLVELEGEIDFPDEEDVPPLDRGRLAAALSAVESRLSSLAGTFRRGDLLRRGATVALCGAPNVGKSSLLNRVAGEERAIVTEHPGTTRDALHAEVEAGGVPLRLVDTAGLREGADAAEREGVLRSRRVLGEAELVLFVLDGSRPAGEEDRDAYGEAAGRPHLVLRNKADLPAREPGDRFRGEGFLGTLSVSARTGEGVDGLLERIASFLSGEGGEAHRAASLARQRHLDAVERARRALARGRRSAEEGMAAEFVAEDVREGTEALAELSGAVAPEEVLDAIFSSFCVGK